MWFLQHSLLQHLKQHLLRYNTYTRFVYRYFVHSGAVIAAILIHVMFGVVISLINRPCAITSLTITSQLLYDKTSITVMDLVTPEAIHTNVVSSAIKRVQSVTNQAVASKNIAKKKTTTVQKNTKSHKELAKTAVPEQEKKECKSSNKQISSQKQQAISATGILDAAQIEYATNEFMNSMRTVWAVPVGVPEGTACTCIISIDKQGNVTIHDMQRSNMLLFDLSVQHALMQIQAPARLCGVSHMQLTFIHERSHAT